MTIDPSSWLLRLKRTYIGNATATRDLRIQLRGGRAAFLFTIYLVVMGIVLLMVYSNSLDDQTHFSLANAQSNLQGFYYATLSSLGVVITLVAPSMGAFAIVTEKQRRSLDLVFSAPTEPKYYLVGKLISAYRYVWLLLVLSLPFCAVSVTLGGATWGQLFLTFLMFSFYGLVCVSFGLLLSTMCSKVLPALIWTYLAIASYLLATGGLMGLSAFSARSPFAAVNPFSSLCPFSFPFIGDQTWPIFGHEMPTWILSILLHLLVVKLVILAAGSLIAPGNSVEIRGLRLHGLVYIGAISYLIAFLADQGWRSVVPFGERGSLSFTDTYTILHGRTLFAILFVLGLMIVPYLAGFGFNDLRRHRPNGFFDIRHTFTGRPSGHLPYLILLFLSCILCYFWGARSAVGSTMYMPFAHPGTTSSVGSAPIESLNPFATYFLMYALLALDFWMISFFVGWKAAGKLPILSRGRTFALFFFVLILILPTALFAIVAGDDARTATGIWSFNPMAGTISELPASGITLYHGLALLCVWVILAVLALPGVRTQSAINLDNPPTKLNNDSQPLGNPQ